MPSIHCVLESYLGEEARGDAVQTHHKCLDECGAADWGCVSDLKGSLKGQDWELGDF